MKAASEGHERVSRLLLAHSDVQADLVNGQWLSALMVAAYNGHKGVVGLLLGVPQINVVLMTKQCGNTAMSCALAEGHSGIVRLLEEFEERQRIPDSGDSNHVDMDRLPLEKAIDEDVRSVASSSDESDIYYDAEESETSYTTDYPQGPEPVQSI
ncbi:hypothetical protein BKA70DRAFT_1300199 [Coprinopsis sp. MPI-PUGE-AT-0042]|nr:hypothetical protein BKA70DRAFT_1336492 [Coprinopsis sp. MPI-PUGE-AT-0042]KAH6903586.1 hypothetical protein BKA70DRAFT_1300199 [Coprinopsis sp. MPI-PUGE-AT-0042]